MAAHAERLKRELIEKIVDRGRRRLPQDRRAPFERFVRQYFANVGPEDLLSEAPETLYGQALAFFHFAAERRPGRPKLRIYNPRFDEHGWSSRHSVLEIVNDDMPFLVDSVTWALSGRGLTVHLIIHPILRVRRDARGGSDG